MYHRAASLAASSGRAIPLLLLRRRSGLCYPPAVVADLRARKVVVSVVATSALALTATAFATGYRGEGSRARSDVVGPSGSDDDEEEEKTRPGSSSSSPSRDPFDVARDWYGESKVEWTKFLNEHVLDDDGSSSRRTGGGGESGGGGGGEEGRDVTEPPSTKKKERTTTASESFEDVLRGLFGSGEDERSGAPESTAVKRGEERGGGSGSGGSGSGFPSLAETFASLLSGKESTAEETVENLLLRARRESSDSDSDSSPNTNAEGSSFLEIARMFDEALQAVHLSLDGSFGHLDFADFDATSLFYYLEREDQRKNPSWKRRMHRFYGGVDVRKVTELNDALRLAELSYADSVEDVEEGLKKATKDDWKLVYCDTESLPGRPGHYLALKKGQSRWYSDDLEVLLVARGTKSVADMFTDALLDAEDYRDGRAHSGIVQSGKYLANKHDKLLRKLLELSGKRKIKMTLIGHSLGAGAATIAAMEFRDRPDESYDVSVVGFGCPALLSRELSESVSDYVTTVVGDSDVIPRMSAATIANVALDVMEYDWTPMGRRDVRQFLNELRSKAPMLVSEAGIERASDVVDSSFQRYVEPKIKEKTTERVEPVLFPPGTCVHFYRDGSGLSGSYVPCDFFGEIDVSRTMVDDHLLERGYGRLFLELMREYHRDEHFSFEERGQGEKDPK